jgi:hypothetical protein
MRLADDYAEWATARERRQTTTRSEQDAVPPVVTIAASMAGRELWVSGWTPPPARLRWRTWRRCSARSNRLRPRGTRCSV